MYRRLPPIFSIGLVSLIVTAAACGGGDGNSNDPTPTIELTGLALDLSNALEQGTTATFRVTYETTDPEGNAGDTYVISNSPTQTRVDTVPVGQTEPNSALIGGGVDDRTIGCSGGPEAWECAEIESLGNSVLRAAGPIGFYSASDLVSFSIVVGDTRMVAGQATTCYELTPAEDKAGEPSEYCLTDQGVVLYASTPSRTVEATDFAAEVGPAAFEPPADVS